MFSGLDVALIVNLLAWLVIGGALGALASVATREGRASALSQVIVGVIGALISGFVVAPLLGIPAIAANVVSGDALLVSLAGAVALLALVNLPRLRVR